MARWEEIEEANLKADELFPDDVRRLRQLFLEEKNGNYNIDTDGNPTVTIEGKSAMVLNLGMQLWLVSDADGVSIKVPIDRKMFKRLKAQYERNIQNSRPIGGLDMADGRSVSPILTTRGQG